jgi:LysR family transcriptional activator of nhaA
VSSLNYHHLRYFWAIATEQSLTKAAERLHVSQSALSIQLKQLEERLGHALFERHNRRLTLTEAGRIALEHANTIFRTGDELVNTLQRGHAAQRQVLRVGAVATLSRNFQYRLLKPLVGNPQVELVLRSGSLRELLTHLGNHLLDVVLSNMPVLRDADAGWTSHLLDQQNVSLVGKPPRGSGARRAFVFPDSLADTPVVLPSLQSDLRVAFDALLDQAGIRPLILAEVDDMAMLRLMARESPGVTLVPPVVVQDELKSGLLVERCRIPQIRESFYAITPSRRFPNPLVRTLIASARSDIESS